MMRSYKFLFGILLFFSTDLCAREVTDTLMSTKNDRVIVTYDIAQSDGQFTIRFISANKSLGRTYKDKYRNKLDELDIAFFDRIGKYSERTEFSGINTEAFMVPSNTGYKSSADGFFLVKDNPSLTFALQSTEATELKIPLFLVHYEKKHRYKVLSRCDDLIVPLKRKATKATNRIETRQVTQTVTSQEEVDTELTEAEEAAILIERIEKLLDLQDGPEFSSDLQQAISRLNGLRVKDRGLSSQIDAVLSVCNQKEKELKGIAQEKADQKAQEEALLAKEEADREKARQDSILAEQQRKVEEDKKQNRWLMIGGTILALLGFTGNKVFQYFQNEKKEKRFSEMQENAIKRAESEAKRRARDLARSQGRQMGGAAKRKISDFTNQNIPGKKGKGSKKATI